MKKAPILKVNHSAPINRLQSEDAKLNSKAKGAAKHRPVEVLRVPYPGDSRREIVLLRATFAPGDSTPPHRHPGLVVGYILTGELEFQLEHRPLQRLASGDPFYESPQAVHLVSRNPGKSVTEVLAFFVQDKGARVMIPLNNPEKPMAMKLKARPTCHR